MSTIEALETAVYTVNDEMRMRALASLGVGGIFSDRPALLREVVNSAPSPRRRG